MFEYRRQRDAYCASHGCRVERLLRRSRRCILGATGFLAGAEGLLTLKTVRVQSITISLLAVTPRGKGTAAAQVGNLLGIVIGEKDTKTAEAGLALLRQAQRSR